MNRTDEIGSAMRVIDQRASDQRASDGPLPHGVAIDVTKQTNLEPELWQAQKLESVGRLATGFAHEINRPIQFVNDSVRFLQTAAEDVMLLAGKHRRMALQLTWIVDDFVEIAGTNSGTGKLTFESARGKGTAFFVTIPFQQHVQEAA